MEVWNWNRSTSLPRVKQCSIFSFFTLCIDCYVITVYKGKTMPLNGKEAWFLVDPWQNPDSIISFIWPVRGFPVQLEGALICNDHSTCGRVWHQNWTLPPWVTPSSAHAPHLWASYRVTRAVRGCCAEIENRSYFFCADYGKGNVRCIVHFPGAKHHPLQIPEQVGTDSDPGDKAQQFSQVRRD